MLIRWVSDVPQEHTLLLLPGRKLRLRNPYKGRTIRARALGGSLRVEAAAVDGLRVPAARRAPGQVPRPLQPGLDAALCFF